MFVLRSSILVQVSKKIFGIINQQGVQITIGKGGWKKSQKLTSGGDVYLALKSIFGKISWKMVSTL